MIFDKTFESVNNFQNVKVLYLVALIHSSYLVN